MVERVKLDPTMEEIVVALRETRQDAERAPPFVVVGRKPGSNRASRGGKDGASRSADAASDGHNGGCSTDIADLRDSEIERLLGENAYLNERVVFLLKIIEHEQAYNTTSKPTPAAPEPDRSAVFSDVRAALAAELRPVLVVLLRLLEKQRGESPEEDARRGPVGARSATPVVAPPGCIADVDGYPAGESEEAGAAPGEMSSQPKLA